MLQKYSKCGKGDCPLFQGVSSLDAVRHIAKFISGIWQIHAFGEGNTRTIAVFTIKYLRSFGFKIDNDLFKEHSWYFRNSLVRANYNDLSKGIAATDQYLMRFLGNLILGENYKLQTERCIFHPKVSTLSL